MTQLLRDVDIIALCENERPLLSDFVVGKQRKGEDGLSYGCSEYGYTARLGTRFGTAKRSYIDPKATQEVNWKFEERTKPFILPAGHTLLTELLERFDFPKNIRGIVDVKSSYGGRSGLITPANPVLEPAWHGICYIAISAPPQVGVMLYPLEGFMQVSFWQMDAEPNEDYGEKGRYQDAS